MTQVSSKFAPVRSLLFCPASRPDRAEKALRSSADAVIIDLEDGVSAGEKETARQQIPAILALSGTLPAARIYLRINGVDAPHAFPDLMAGMLPGLTGIMLPKVEEAFQVKEVSWVISALERERGLEAGQIEVIPLIETAAGVLQAESIARSSSRVARLAFGFLDLTLDINTSYTLAGSETFYSRSHLVLASRAANLLPPLDGVYPNIRDKAGLEEETCRVRQLGFGGKLLIHPGQVEVANRVFTPAPEEIAEARRIDAAFREAESRGVGAIELDGKIVDYPVVRRARQVLALLERLGMGENPYLN